MIFLYFILYFFHIYSEQDAANILNEAERLNMTRSGYAWIVTEQSLVGEALEAAPLGILGITLNGSKNTSAHILDALRVVARGYHSFIVDSEDSTFVDGPPADCREEPWQSGATFYK